MSTWIVMMILGGVGVLTLILFLYASFGLMFVFGAPWVPTSPAVAREMLRAASVREGETVLDLGCGHGVISILAAREFGARGIGLDIHPGLIWWARWRALVVPRHTRTHTYHPRGVCAYRCAWHGTARHGTARHGMARHGAAWHGVAANQ